jgi:hypothetical protein
LPEHRPCPFRRRDKVGGLGALQALHAYSGIEGIDYLSTVSGGGYTGCSLTAAMQNTDGNFPFTDPNTYADTDSVRHIRDYSNYLIPHGALDVVTAIGIIGRGLVANVLIVLPVLLLFVWFTLVIHPTVESLSEPKFLVWDLRGLTNKLGMQELQGYWFTIILAGVNIAFLVVWAFAKSISVSRWWRTISDVWRTVFGQPRNPGDSAELRGVLVTVSKVLFFITLTSAWFETQPFILRAMTAPSSYGVGACASSVFSNECLGAVLHGWFARVTPWLAPVGAVFAFVSNYLGDIVALAKRDTRWQGWVKKISAQAALWFAAIIIPSFLWLLYLQLTYFGISNPDFPYLPDWLSSFTHATPKAISELPNFVRCLVPKAAALVYLEAFPITGLVALFINPNATSLYRLYRDRLSKAFLFYPQKRENPRKQDNPHDLQAYEPKLHQIDTNLCPYPIINAALNIEGSQYANKRGRNADFFVFTPEYTGSGATRYIGTQWIEKEETDLDLGTAMAISGAAVSPDMGALTIKPLTFTLALLNVRLGYWLRNPNVIRQSRSLLSRLLDRRTFLLFKEMFGLITEKSRTVFLTDGGHIENLGVYSLLKRRCGLIIAVDAEADPAMSFHALLKLERYARIDLGAIIELPWQDIRDKTLEIDKAFEDADKTDKNGKSGPAILSSPGPHCAAGEIQYGPNETGILLYVKASLSGDEDDYLLDYKRRNRAFPHETTGDQFFGEEQLEAYRALGFHIVKGLLTGETPFAVVQDPKEPEDQKRGRILSTIRAALLGTPAKP